MKRYLVVALLLFPLISFAYQSPGKPTGFVNDFAGLFSVDEKTNLEQNLEQFNKDSSNEVSVVTIQSLNGDTVENFANKLFAEWGIGKVKQDNGVLLLIARNDRAMRIEVGYGLEAALPDATTSYIIRTILTPAFKAGNFGSGTLDAVSAIEAATKGEYAPAVSSQNAGSIFISSLFSSGSLQFTLLAFIFFSSMLARSKTWWAGGLVGAGLGLGIGWFFGFLYFGIVALLVFVPLGLLLDFVVSKKYKNSISSGSTPPWWIGGGGGGSSGGGFGGFGGGSSGGGGASGSW